MSQAATDTGDGLTRPFRRVGASVTSTGFRLILRLASVLIVLLALAPLAPPTRAETCTFVLGFKTLHDLIPDVVGNCVVDEHHNPANGDALQETTRGLLVWRKADNFTAFTDGYRTWVNGPLGLQVRLNTERFAWEADQASAAVGACLSRPDSKVKGREVDVVDWRVQPRSPSSGWAVVGRVRNNCPEIREVGLNVTVLDQEGRPVGITTAGYWRLGPGEVREFSLPTGPLPRSPLQTSFRTLSTTPVALDSVDCLDVGTTRCLRADFRLTNAIKELRRVERGEWLLRVAAENGVTIRRSDLPSGTLGQYARRGKIVRIDVGLDTYSDWERATVIAHELQHAHDDVAGRLLPGAEGCLKNEEDAFRRGAEIWTALWQGRLPAPQNGVQEELNAIALAIARDPVGFVAELSRIYRTECSVH